MYELSPRQLAPLIEIDLAAGCVPFVRGKPGIGKSALARMIAHKLNLKLIDCRLSTMDPTDLTGLPFRDGNRSEFMPFKMFPIEGDTIPQGYSGWLLFFDELNSCTKATEAAAYKIVLDRMVGQFPLHKAVKVMAAGNRAEDKAIVRPLGTAMRSRITHYHMKEPTHIEFLEDVVYPQKWDIRIAAYLEMRPSHVDLFDPDSDDDTFTCPRTWEFAHKKLTVIGPVVEDWHSPAFTGAMTPLVAEEFLVFCQIYTRLPSISDILKDPKNAPIPTEPEIVFALSSVLAEGFETDKTDKALVEYVMRFPNFEHKAMFSRAVFGRGADRFNEHLKRLMAHIGKT